ncbi:NADAR family protein [Chitinophaga sp. Hz27]|uniref:NADAR family protein n=1 Tax=Chitinophaga sp. Hz27 TaxID=3347169 RepID=UPI0035E38ABF
MEKITRYNLEWLLAQSEHAATIKYLFFWGHTPAANGQLGKECFSQWYEAPFTADGHRYLTAEHWMMAQKALLFNDQPIFQQVLACKTPGEAKKLGRKVRNFDEHTWNQHRCDIVRNGNVYKFGQHDNLKTYLLNTGNRILVEASPLDKIWGIGMGKDNPNATQPASWKGLNLLGFALMEARDILSKQ